MDELDERLRRSDPLTPEWSPEPPDGPRARALLEHIVSTPVVETSASPAPRRSRHRWWWIGAGATAAALVVGGAIVATRDGSDEPAAAPVTFQLAAGDTMQSCLAVTEFIPDPSSQAFAGTVTAVEADTVTMEVDRWYTGEEGRPEVVELSAGTGVPVALDGVEFVAGERYLVTTMQGEVLICGVSGPATPELENLYEQWYA